MCLTPIYNDVVTIYGWLSDRDPHGDVVVIHVEGDQLVQGPQRGRGDEVQLVVSDGEILEITCILILKWFCWIQMKHLLTSRFTQVLFYFSNVLRESFVAFGTPLKIARNIPTKTRNIFHEISSQNITMRVNTFLRSAPLSFVQWSGLSPMSQLQQLMATLSHLPILWRPHCQCVLSCCSRGRARWLAAVPQSPLLSAPWAGYGSLPGCRVCPDLSRANEPNKWHVIRIALEWDDNEWDWEWNENLTFKCALM